MFMHLSPDDRFTGLYNILVMEEFDAPAGLIIERYKARPSTYRNGGVVLAGHPGIGTIIPFAAMITLTVLLGKSTFLRYFAIRMVLAGLDIYLLSEDLSTIRCFTAEGRFDVPVTEEGLEMLESERGTFPPGLLLVDHLPGCAIPPILSSASHSFFICLATSGTRENYKSLAKRRGLETIWVQPNKWEDVYLVWYVFLACSSSIDWFQPISHERRTLHLEMEGHLSTILAVSAGMPRNCRSMARTFRRI